MCNEAYRRVTLGQVRDDWSELKIRLVFPESIPNFAPLDSIRITDRAEIIRAGKETGTAEMVTRRWSWPGASGKPIYNFRSDEREFRDGVGHGRCLIPVEGFFEFTNPPPSDNARTTRVARRPKSKWAFTVAGFEWFAIAGLWRTDPSVGEAWTMLTCPPGPDILPYHHRQVVVLTPADYDGWLSGDTPARDVCRPLAPGTLVARQIR